MSAPLHLILGTMLVAVAPAEAPNPFPGVKSRWEGFVRHDFRVDGANVIVVEPKEPLPGRPWAWRGEFFGAFPNADIELVKSGWHLVYIGVPDLFGSPKAMKHWERFYNLLVKNYGFSAKPALIGLSRGALYCMAWAANHPEKTLLVYLDNGVCDFKSWPGGKPKGLGTGQGSPDEWRKLLKAYDFKDDREAIAFKFNPVDNLAPLARSKVPILLVYGDSDTVVPHQENSALIHDRFKALGGAVERIVKPGQDHHPHGLTDPRPIVAFFEKVRFSGAAPPPACDMQGYHPQPGLEVSSQVGGLTVRWDGAQEQELLVKLAIVDGAPTVRELAARKKGSEWATIGRDLVPEFSLTTGVRRTGHGLSYENRWDVFWDAPLNNAKEVRRFHASYHADRCEVRTDGARLEISYPGLNMGSFSGDLRFTIYRGTNLLRVEAIAKTDEPSVAYIYQGGLKGFSPDVLPRMLWHDVRGRQQTSEVSGSKPGTSIILRARNRLAIAEGRVGSVAFFPPPHQFFFARELEVNLGYVWFRKDAEKTYSMGIRQGESAEGYNPVWSEKVFSLYNAPPDTLQRMPVYFLVSPDDGAACGESVMAFTHGDRFKALPGYKTMVTHFHTAFTQELIDSGSLDTTPPWIPLMRSMGIEIAHIFDFHGDGHPHDPGPLRLKELANYFEACRRHSDGDFLIIPGEEANAYLGGHYNVLFPKPVYWTLVRGNDQPLTTSHPSYGNVYHTGRADDVFEMMKAEDALVWTTHPRTKGSTDYPDKIRDTDYFKSGNWLGSAFKAMPVDLSQKRLGEVRCFGTLDDMNNWGGPKYMVGEVDTYKKFPDYDLYGDFNVNYVKLDRVPSFDDWSPVCRALRTGKFFVTTGEVLIPHWGIEGSGKDRVVFADVEWTFPLEFVEAVWGDGEHVGRRVISATDRPPFGSHRFRIPFDAAGKKWVRFSVWDSAGNGAFTQPVHL